MRVGICQFAAIPGHVGGNATEMMRLLEEGQRGGADMLCFPELSLPGYLLDRASYTPALLGNLQRAEEDVRSTAQSLGVGVVYGTARTSRRGLQNVVVMYSASAHEWVYAKSHLPAPEREVFAPGDAIVTAGGEWALGCCYDLAFPQFCAALADSGARAFLFPMAWECERAYVYEQLVGARAIENLAYVICSNQTGDIGAISFYGRSRIVDPWGEVVARMGRETGVICAEIDLSLVVALRDRGDARAYPLLADRRPLDRNPQSPAAGQAWSRT